MIRIAFLALLLNMCSSALVQAQDAASRTITITSQNYQEDYAVIGYYYGDRQLVLDTVNRDADGKYIYNSDEKMKEGVYLLLLSPNNRYIQFLVNSEEGDMGIAVDTNNLGQPIITGSDENQLFLDYVSFLNLKGRENETLASQKNALAESGGDTKKIDDQRSALDQEVKAYQNSIVEGKSRSVTSKLIASTLDVQIPEFSGSVEEVQNSKYYYYTKH